MSNDKAKKRIIGGTAKRAVVYARVSTDEQAERGYSIQSQLEACRKYASTHGFTVVAELADDCSGAIPIIERPEGHKLYELIDSGTVEMVILYTHDRTARDEKVIEYLLFKSHIYEKGLELHYSDTGLDPYTMEGNLVGYIKAHAAAEERKKIIERTRRGKLAKAKAGKWVGECRFSYGFRKEGEGPETKLVLDVARAAIVQRIFSSYVGSLDQQPMSVQCIAKILTTESVPSPRDGKGWYRSTINLILSNRAYIGEFEYAGLVIPFPELAIIDRATFEAAQDRKKKNKERAKRNRKREYLLVGHINCSCGCRMHGQPINEIRTYYVCNRRVNNPHLTDCREKVIPTCKADIAVWDWLYNLLKDEAQLDEGLRAMSSQRAAELEPKQKRLEAIGAEIEKSERTVARLASVIARTEDEVALGALEKEIQLASKQKKSYMAEHERLMAELSQWTMTEENIQAIKAKVAKVRKMLDKATFEDKRFLLDALDVTAQVAYRDGKRGLLVTCGIATEQDFIPIADSGSPSSR